MTEVAVLSRSLALPCGAVLPNRLAKSAMSEALGTADNHPTEALVALYERWGRGGLGLCITGNVMIDGRALGEPNNVLVEDERDLALLTRWAQAAQRAGTPCWVQINHPGKQVPRGLNHDAVAPSAVPFSPELARFFVTPRALSELEIEGLIERYANTARIVQRAGFSGVQIHGAHGYLVSQFLSPHHNRRADRWGGSALKRMRFVLEVYRSIRAAVGERFPVSIKLNSADFQRGGFTHEESLDVIRALSEAGIDLIEISGGTYEAPRMMGAREAHADSTRQREAYFLAFAEQARAVTRTPLMVTGGFRSLAGMVEAVASGATDLVGLARPLAIEPELAMRVLAGLEPAQHVQPVRTGVSALDRMGFLELAYYGRQLRRMGRGHDPEPSESAWGVLVRELAGNGVRLWKSRRLRA